MKKIILLFVFSSVTLCFYSCKKYLEAKPDKSLQIPSSVADLQALLDFGNYMNGQNGVSFDESSADNFYVTEDVYNQFNEENRNTYIWSNKDYNNYPNDWAYIYNVINIANVVLDNISKIKSDPQNQIAWNNAKGCALFFRAYSFLQGAFIFCKAYDEETANEDYGMALRLTSDFDLPSTRSTLKETYNRIIEDLKEANTLLPDLPVHVLRPSRVASYALLARTYLSMRIYDSCLKYANLSLKLKNDLIDYNTLSASASYPFTRYNVEEIFDNVITQPNYYASSRYYALIDTLLYDSYDKNDLRKNLFFKKRPEGYSFKGSYARSSQFIGIATDEVYLMRAECYARLGNTNSALEDLNTLMNTRWVSGTFVPFVGTTSQDALTLILNERRKELIFRNIRWMDIKRLNKEGANITLKRIINGETYTLVPNDNKYALPLPDDIIKMTGMPQNPF